MSLVMSFEIAIENFDWDLLFRHYVKKVLNSIMKEKGIINVKKIIIDEKKLHTTMKIFYNNISAASSSFKHKLSKIVINDIVFSNDYDHQMLIYVPSIYAFNEYFNVEEENPRLPDYFEIECMAIFLFKFYNTVIGKRQTRAERGK